MKQTFSHRPNLIIKAKFSLEPIPLYRYRLDATKTPASKSPKTVCAIMQNPSYAGVNIADKSVQVLERVVFEKELPEFYGVENLIIVNQFAFIQTKNFIGTIDKIGSENNQTIQQAIDESHIILVAWGKGNRFTERQKSITKMFEEKKGKTLLKTSRHPSRVIYDGFIQEYN